MPQKQKTILGIFFAFIFAQKEHFAINVNPIRDSDFWKNTESLNSFIQFQKKITFDNNFLS